MSYPTGAALKTCCRNDTWRHICACRIWAGRPPVNTAALYLSKSGEVERRPDWVPADVSNEDIDWYVQTTGGQVARLKHEVKALGATHLFADIDQLTAKIHHRWMTL